jgi:amino acid adenylation domain-containing protein/thioester reductase-like protein
MYYMTTSISGSPEQNPFAESEEVPLGDTYVFPLSFQQQRLWFLEQLEPNSVLYNILAAICLQGVFQIDVLERALAALAERHETLRTSIKVVDDEPAQVVTIIGMPSVESIDLSSFPQDIREAKVRQLATEEAARPFDLEQGPLLRATIYRLGSRDHILLLAMHHIISDGWSIGILIRELASLYAAFAEGLPSPLFPLPLQYADYAIWQRQWLSEARLESQLAYWRERLANAPTALDIPTDHPRPPVQTFAGATSLFHISPGLVQQIYWLSQQVGATPFMTLLAAFAILLSRLANQDDLLIGTPIANRSRPELEEIIGFFANTLVLRVDVKGNPTFLEVVGRVREMCLGAYTHQDIPFEKLVEDMRPERDLSRNPLFQVMFVLQNAPMPSLDFAGVTITPLEMEASLSKFDLSLSLREVSGGLEGTFGYNTDLFDAATITWFVMHYQQIIEEIAQAPEMHISDISLFDAEAWRAIITTRNATDASFPDNTCLHQLIEQMAELAPDRTALVYEGNQLTYAELNHHANQLAHYLRQMGAAPEQLIGICLERSLDLVVGLLGILKAGAAYVPLDPHFPQERLAYMIEDARIGILISQSSLIQLLPAHSSRDVLIDRDWPLIASYPTTEPYQTASPENLAYVLYTSGSTGKPKGVQITHRSLVNFLYSLRETLGMVESDIMAAVTTLSFDIAGLELYLPLLCGAQTIIVPREVAINGELLAQTLTSTGATLMQATPSTWRMLLDIGWRGSSLRAILCGGEALPLNLARALVDTGRPLWNLYGPTETTIWSSLQMIADKAEDITLGDPINNTQIYILDQHMQAVPVGAVGEVYIGGMGLARGYLHRPDQTAERFLPNPFASHPGERIYRTGDLARLCADGAFQFVGRIDNQVKLRGYRIELGEIETVLRKHASVLDAVALVREDSPGDKRLVAYLKIAREEDEQQLRERIIPQMKQELQSLLRMNLPEYMLPAHYLFLDTWPLTPNGKIDRRALPIPGGESSITSREYIAPQTPLEEQVAQIFSRVLNLDRAGITDDFFELGGHSLLVVQLMKALRNAYDIDIPLRALFLKPTVAGITESVKMYLDSDHATNIPVQGADLPEEAKLDPAIDPTGLQQADIMNPAHILLTGATGFLGAFLLAELLDKTQATIYCLVRAANPEEGRERIETQLRHYHIWNDDYQSRIVSIDGDLAKARFGVEDEQYQWLAANIDAIYHSGALVNFIYPYSALKASNVLGTEEILRLACHTKIKAVHHVSTVDVLSARHDADRTIREEMLPYATDNTSGYIQSKWVAERLVQSAIDRGLPCVIYRPWLITGHSETGVTHTTDYLCLALKSNIQLGIVPDHEQAINVMPVDYVSKGIVALSRMPQSLGKIFHFANPSDTSLTDVYGWVRDFGYSLRAIPPYAWYEQMSKVSAEYANYPLLPLMEVVPGKHENFQIDCSNTLRELQGTDIVCPPFHKDHLFADLTYLIDIGFLDSPVKHDQAHGKDLDLQPVN